jgi:transcriptional regulator with XRE-family HTH domain
VTGSELAEIRRTSGLSQNLMAQYCGISRVSVWRYEKDLESIPRAVELSASTAVPGNKNFEDWIARQPGKYQILMRRRQSRNAPEKEPECQDL